jgi:hypothetical protein
VAALLVGVASTVAVVYYALGRVLAVRMGVDHHAPPGFTPVAGVQDPRTDMASGPRTDVAAGSMMEAVRAWDPGVTWAPSPDSPLRSPLPLDAEEASCDPPPAPDPPSPPDARPAPGPRRNPGRSRPSQ